MAHLAPLEKQMGPLTAPEKKKGLATIFLTLTNLFEFEALESVTKSRGATLCLVNPAYTSQIDSNTQYLEGKRVHDKFHHVNGEISQADINAAINIKHRQC